MFTRFSDRLTDDDNVPSLFGVFEGLSAIDKDVCFKDHSMKGNTRTEMEFNSSWIICNPNGKSREQGEREKRKGQEIRANKRKWKLVIRNSDGVVRVRVSCFAVLGV